MSTWHSGYRALMAADATWMAEDVELAPEWLQEEMRSSTEELRSWMSSQGWAPANSSSPRRQAKRGRKPRR